MLDSQLKLKINLLWNKFGSGGVSNLLQKKEQIKDLLNVNVLMQKAFKEELVI